MSVRSKPHVLLLSGGGLWFAACVPPGGCGNTDVGNLEVLVGDSVVFDSNTGFNDSFLYSNNALAPVPVYSFSASRLTVRYSDNFSTFNSSLTAGSSQEEVLVLARDPLEYRATLESIVAESVNEFETHGFMTLVTNGSSGRVDVDG